MKQGPHFARLHVCISPKPKPCNPVTPPQQNKPPCRYAPRKLKPKPCTLPSNKTLCRYAPRKPKYFNRIHTGYEWNKYNQTHYDTENPPPKVVQGYKFNIFYPDLLDKSVAPTYRCVY